MVILSPIYLFLIESYADGKESHPPPAHPEIDPGSEGQLFHLFLL